MPYIQKELGGTRVRAVGALSAEHAALLAGLSLTAGDARGNAVRVRDRAGWPVLGGFVLHERADGSGYLGMPHHWNATPRGLWVDATPRLNGNDLLVLVASAKTSAPPPPFEALAASPLVIVAVEGLCNRLRAVLSYRQVAHAQGRPLHVVWRRDEFCNGDFLDHFLPLPGVKFLKQPPRDRSPSSLSVAVDTHASIKNTPAEAHGYAALHPTDAVRAAIAAQLEACGPRFVAMHVRRTDLHTALPASEHTRDGEFEAFADARPTGCNIYVATDNAPSQRHFCERYGGAARVQKPIEPSGSLRQTALREAVVDLFTCAAAPDGFKGSHGSSFSDAIRCLRRVQGRGGAESAVVDLR